MLHNFRGKFLIHASKNLNKEKCKSLGNVHTKLDRGAIIGRAILYDFKKYRLRLSYLPFYLLSLTEDSKENKFVESCGC
jgi:hypothetical protein